MASRGRRGGASTREDEPRRDERAEQQAPTPQGPVLPPPPPVDYGVFMQGACWIIEEGFPDLDLLWRLLKNPEGSYLGD
ncbi:hypothetical protein Taro_004812 [Colocasia esculenta]|uniref:Uncharacterized protein n=1 Tax=Colocasia esculenta TaxID=4460 RepID=A0A843TR85_COLES|nr:hypothetical protein [Colocasia esculenta]